MNASEAVWDYQRLESLIQIRPRLHHMSKTSSTMAEGFIQDRHTWQDLFRSLQLIREEATICLTRHYHCSKKTLSNTLNGTTLYWQVFGRSRIDEAGIAVYVAFAFMFVSFKWCADVLPSRPNFATLSILPKHIGLQYLFSSQTDPSCTLNELTCCVKWTGDGALSAWGCGSLQRRRFSCGWQIGML